MPKIRTNINKTLGEKPDKVIVELPFGLGDIIMCFPLFATLRKNYPKAQITALSPNRISGELLKMNPNIDGFYEYGISKFSKKSLLKFFYSRFGAMKIFFKKNQFDLFIVVHHNLYRLIMLKLLPIRQYIYNYDNIHKTKECMNITDFLGLKMIFDYSLNVEDNTKTLSKLGLKKNNYIVIDMYAQHLEKDPRQWPHFNELINMYLSSGYTVVPAGINPNHKSVKGTVDIVNKTDLKTLLSIIKSAKIVISMDTSFFHFSYAQKTPVLALFGPVNPEDRKPINYGGKMSIIYKKEFCSPCIKNRVDINCPHAYRCMRSITAQEVFDKSVELMQKTK